MGRLTAWRGTIAGLVLGTTVASSPSCKSSEAFVCEDDSACSRPDAIGMCQPNNYCSFPDANCPSGQRYGELAGGGFAGLCVEDGTTATDMPVTGTTGAPGTTSIDPSSDETLGADSATTITASDGMTTGASDCDKSTHLVDDFDDGSIDPLWMVVLPELIEETDEGLTLQIWPELRDGYPQVRPMPVPWDITDGYVRMRPDTIPAQTGAVVFISVYSEAGVITLEIYDGVLSASYDVGFMGRTIAGEVPYTPDQHQWLQIRSSGNTVFWEASGDGVEFFDVAVAKAPFALNAVTPTITVGNDIVLPRIDFAIIDTFEMCAD